MTWRRHWPILTILAVLLALTLAACAQGGMAADDDRPRGFYGGVSGGFAY